MDVEPMRNKIRNSDKTGEQLGVIPEWEQWLWNNAEALASVKRGLEESARGEGRSLGSFTQYADDED